MYTNKKEVLLIHLHVFGKCTTVKLLLIWTRVCTIAMFCVLYLIELPFIVYLSESCLRKCPLHLPTPKKTKNV